MVPATSGQAPTSVAGTDESQLSPRVENRSSAIKNICLFAHFDRDNKVAAYVVRYVAAIAAIGFDVIFISACSPSEQELAPLQGICTDIILRENVGHDFGSWAEGFRRHERSLTGELMLANDSVYGPIGDLGIAVDRLRQLDAGMAGFVESAAHAMHLQSWFLLIRPEAYRNTLFHNVLLTDYSRRAKTEIIQSGEIGLSRAVRESGLRIAGLFSDVNFVFAGHPFNPTMLLWRELIEEADCPFIKIELLRDNPCQIPGLDAWRQVVSKRAPELIDMIAAHLERSPRRQTAFVAQRFRLPPSLFHYWGWYRRAYRLRTSTWLLRHINNVGFECLWTANRKIPLIRGLIRCMMIAP